MLYITFICYSVGIAVIYSLPIGLENEWYRFYAYLDRHGALPYIDVREGYPPLGFLIYMPIYYLSHGDQTLFFYGFRILNGALLIATTFSLYLILKSALCDKKSLKLAMYYGSMPSVIIANAYSNDVVALLPAALGILMITRKKPLSCGVLLGLAALGKGFPALLLIPALIAFKKPTARFKVLCSMFFTLVFASLPFLLVNPFTYISTFTHHGSRGPWETIWAFIDGYYSHGGLLHPYFDKFFYHFNLLKVYPASHYDHAVYRWNFTWLPHLLTVTQIAVLIVLALGYDRKKILSLCGLTYISYILFFKGYSTQFSVSTQFYMILAAMNRPLVFMIPLEVSQIMQMLSWQAQTLAPEFLRNEHLPLLVSSTAIRSVVFTYLTLDALTKTRIDPKKLTMSLKRFTFYLDVFKDKIFLLLLLAVILTASISSATLISYINSESDFKSFNGELEASKDEWSTININGLKGDQVIVKLATNDWLDVKALSDSSEFHVERGIVNPYNLKGSFNQTMIFFTAPARSCRLMLKMKHPGTPFKVEGSSSDLRIDAAVYNSTLILNLQDQGVDGRSSILRMAYPCEVYVEEDFTLNLRYKILYGRVSNVYLEVFDDTDEWLYSFQATENFTLKPDTKDIHGYSNLSNDRISLIVITVIIGDGASAKIKLDELSINDDKTCKVRFYAKNNKSLRYKVFIERDFRPPVHYLAASIASVTLTVATAHRLYRRIERKVLCREIL